MTKSGQWLPGEETLKSLYSTSTEEARQKAEALAERGENWNRNPNEAARSLYGVTEKELAAAEAARIEKFRQDDPAGFAQWESDQAREKASAKAEADRLWQERYDADNAAQRAHDEATRQAAEEWQEKNRQRVMGGR